MSTSTETWEKRIASVESGATMRAGVLCDVARVEVWDVPFPEVGPHEVLVRVSAQRYNDASDIDRLVEVLAERGFGRSNGSREAARASAIVSG